MLNLKCNIEIRSKDNKKIIFDYVNNISVKTSCKNLTDTAVVKIPRRVKWREQELTKFINRDDEITIQTGYSQHGIETIFTGYLTAIENDHLITINCENEMRKFKTIDVPAEKIEKFDLKQYLKKYGNVEVESADTLTFGSMDITESMTLAQALDKIMQVYPYVKGYFQDGKFCAVLDNRRWGDGKKPIIFDPNRNMISDTLKYTLAEDIKIGVKAVSILQDNSKIEAYSPQNAFDGDKIKNGYEQRQFFCPQCTDVHSVQEYADKVVSDRKDTNN